MSTVTILAARLVVPPDLIAPAARSPIFKKIMRPEERPPPDERPPLAPTVREIGAGPGAVFEDARLAHPQIHDPAFVDEIVGDRLDEAGGRLRMLVGGLRLHDVCGSKAD